MLMQAQRSAAGWPALPPALAGYRAPRAAQAAMIGRMRRPGLSGTTEQNIMSSVQIAGATVSTASALGAGWATAAIPIVGPVIAGVTIGLSMLFGRKGPKQKVATTKIVDAVEPELKKNVEGYLAGARNVSSQAQALANFDAGWQYVVEHCDIPEMGDPGKRCVSDRQRGGQWDWFSYYRDPIANDPGVQPDPTIVDSVLSVLGGGGGAAAGAAESGISLGALAIPAGLLALALLM